jgi:hypothetical protein
MSNITPVTIDAAITSADVVAYIANPDAHPISYLVEDPATVAARIEAQEIAAATPEQLFGGTADALHGEDLIGRDFQIMSVSWRQSDYAETGGFPVFGVFTITLADGSIETLVCGARSVVRKTAIADARGWLPYWVKMTAIPSSTKGQKPILDLITGTAPVQLADGGTF